MLKQDVVLFVLPVSNSWLFSLFYFRKANIKKRISLRPYTHAEKNYMII